METPNELESFLNFSIETIQIIRNIDDIFNPPANSTEVPRRQLTTS